MQDKLKLYGLLLFIDLWAGIPIGALCYYNPDRQTDGIVGASLLFIFNLIVIVHIQWGDKIIGALISRDLEDFKNGKYWTPFGKRDVPEGTTISDMIENTKKHLEKTL